jgi:hypothetical protein
VSLPSPALDQDQCGRRAMLQNGINDQPSPAHDRASGGCRLATDPLLSSIPTLKMELFDDL